MRESARIQARSIAGTEARAPQKTVVRSIGAPRELSPPSARAADATYDTAMSPACLFCEIVAGGRPSVRVLENVSSLAFLDTRPLFPGHTLVIPRAHVETLGELSPSAVGPLFTDVRRVTRAVERACKADGSFVAMNNRVSQSVPHLHIHIVPRKAKDGLRGFFWPRQKYAGQEAIEAIGRAIREAVEEAVEIE
jgi:histidine triad (HIT) family protein